MKKILLFSALLLCFLGHILAQNVFDPNDPIVRYSSSAAYGTQQKPDSNIVGLQKWVANATNGVSTGSGNFKALSETFKAYFIRYTDTRLAFRVKFPKSYSNPDSANKIYPMMLFMHGGGEVACASNGGIYNNEKQLILGGYTFAQRVDNNLFDGFLIYPQLRSKDNGCWGEWGGGANANFLTIMTFIDSLVKYARADNDRLFVDGLSAGGVASWRLAESFPQRVTKIAPTSAAGLVMNYPAFIHIPIWLATGGKDTNPSPAQATYSVDNVNSLGGSIRQSLYPDLGHSSWDRHWAEADFVSFMNDMHKANPLIFFNRFEFCPDSVISTRIGITGGFAAYEWQKDGVTIARRENGVNTITTAGQSSIINYAAGGNELTVKSFGSYRARFKRTASGQWSAWSMKPAEIKPKATTVPPPIQVVGVKSFVLPSLDGDTKVPLQMPAGYLNYQWYRASDNVLVNSSQVYQAPVGSYKAKYTEPYGCGSEFSPVFTVVNAAGSPKPDAAKNLSASSVSQTAIRLDWSDNPNAVMNETGFEIYRGTKAGGPYTLLTTTAPNVITYMDQNLTPNTQYFYVVRAISATGAAAASNESDATTIVDNIAPTAPVNLQYWGSTQTTVNLKWQASTDDIGVSRYDIFVNGVKTFSTTNLSFTVSGLDSLTSYSIVVKAVDKANNYSPASNQIVAFTHRQGLNYKYYEGSFGNNLPNFSTLTPVRQGITDTVNAGSNIGAREDNYAILWEGKIYIPADGNYTFETNSDDGSKLYIDVPYSFNATALVSNDGAHGATSKTGTIFLTKGYHGFVAAFAEIGGDALMEVYWASNTGIARQLIPKNFYALDEFEEAPVAAPTAVSATAVSYNKINLTWNDNSNNETGFEIYRSTAMNGVFTAVGSVPTNTTSFSDSGLTVSTRYYYKVRAISAEGQSEYAYNYTEVNWKLNNDYTDANGDAGRTLNSNSGASFSTTRQEGSHSVSLTSSGYLGLNNTNGGFLISGGYDQRTVALWIRPSGTFTNRRMVFEFGDNSNGLGLRFNSSVLEAGIASGGTRVSASYSNVFSASGTPWVTNGWNHVAVVYDKTSLKLYLNGVNVASNNSLTFASVGSSTNASRFGYPSATGASNSVFNDGSTWTYLGGNMDDIYVFRGALAGSEIASLRALTFNTQSAATTLAPPAAPAVPTGLAATALSTSAIKLDWNDNSANETGFEIWRSSGDKSNDRMIALVEGGSGAQKTFTDTSLFANVTYYFKVKARGAVLNSPFTAEVNAKTLNSKPVIKDVLDFTMLYGTSFTLPLSATDADGDALTFTASGLPAFGTLQNGSGNAGSIVFNPSSRNRGSFRINVYVADPNGGKDTTSFVLAVNTNDVPVMPAIANIVINEGASVNVPVSATDKNGTSKMIWRTEGLPSFANFVNNNNGTGTVAIHTDYASSGEYEITVFVDDGYGAWTSQTFMLTVTDVEPDAPIQINFRQNTGGVPLWNDVVIAGLTHAAPITDTKGDVYPINFAFTRGSVAATQSGRITGDDSGVYPDNILKDAMAWGFNNNVNDTVILRVSGLDQTKRYDFTLFSGFTSGVASTYMQYVIGTDTARLYYYNNTQNTATIQNVQPNASGYVFITMIGDPVMSQGGALNAMVIRPLFNDGTAPAKPLQFNGEFILGTGVKLNWVDRAYNETGYRVYRSTNKNGAYTLLNPQVDKDSVNFLDPNTQPETTYYYYVAGINQVGLGASSDTIKIITGNNLPVINVANQMVAKTGATTNFDFTATDDPGDIVTVTLTKKPGFVTLQHLGGANYRIVASPLTDHLGWFTMTLTATDNKGASSTKDVVLAVSDKNTRSVYINFGREDKPAPFPWNNWLGARGSNNALANLKDEQNNTTPFGITTVDAWTGVTTMGHMTGNNSGIFPDAVLESGLNNLGGPRTIRFSGLNNNMRYNIVFVGSMNSGELATAQYNHVGGTASDTLNARNNTNQSANLNGLAPVGGQISAQVLRILGSENTYLNAIVLEEYDPNLLTAPLNPINLYAEPVDRTAIDLSWSDRTVEEAAVNGYMLDRATDSMFTMNVVNIGLPANTSTYRDAGLSANKKYWYRVRARSAGGTYSDYSNRAKAITPASIVLVNFNYTVDNAPAPWNNIYASPTYPGVFTGLKNQSGITTGLTLSLTKIFNGEFNAGFNTNNNSGIVLDIVMQSDFWLDNTQESQFVLSGLNHSRRYRIGFFGSSAPPWPKGNYTATYTVNGRTVYLNSWVNSSKIVYIDDIEPDVNGEAKLNFSTTNDAQYGFNGAVIIQEYTDDSQGGTVGNNIVNVPNSANILTATDDADAADQAMAAAREAGSVRMYPNPVVDFMNVDFNNASASDNVSLMVYDLSGKLLYLRNYGSLSVGPHTLSLNAKESAMTTGVYFVALNVNGKTVQTTKIIKTKK